MKLTIEEIEAGRSPNGGYTKAQFAAWGIAWPPPTGWKEKLLNGDAFERQIKPSVVRPELDANELLRQVVLAVVERGHGDDLIDYPDVLAYFGAQKPDDPVSAKCTVVFDNTQQGDPF